MIERFIYENREDWKQFRKNLFTASQINRLTAKTKNACGLSDGAITYILELINNEKGEPKPDIFNAAMEWGNEQEPQAVLRYAEDNNLDVNADDFIYTSVGGFVFFVYNKIAGGTPDLILKDKIVEIKCPNSDTHLYNYLFVNSENFQKEYPIYYDQIQFNMFLCEKKQAVFMSFDPRIKKVENQVKYINIDYDAERVNLILDKIFDAEVLKTSLLNQLENN
jgi:hypothetical protein